MTRDMLQKLMRDALRETLEESKELARSQTENVSRGTPTLKTSRLKEFAISALPEGSALRNVLLSERDEVDVDEFVAKMDVWLRLLRMEFS